jgi:amino acid adenylation domain-containing protein
MLRDGPLHSGFEESALRCRDRIAIETVPGASITYGALAKLSDRVRDRLRHLGVRPGDRVGICCRKSIDAVAAILGVLKAGAAYVPGDPHAPAARNAYILSDCAVRAALIEADLARSLKPELERLGAGPQLFLIHGAGDGLPLSAALAVADDRDAAPGTETWYSEPDELAYILYTSGSTGRPKGVMLSHRNATSFLNWCSETFAPTDDERFSSHAPLHFDLSILDLYVPLRHAATVVLIDSDLGKDPARLARLIADRRLTSWYSAPSILSLLVQYGNLGSHDYSSLRRVLFAGEVFPVRYLRALVAALHHPRYFNLYGPTETNVCTFHEIPRVIPEDRTEPYPIGKACSHLAARVVDGGGHDVPAGSEGELCIVGPGVTSGYWNLAEQTARAFLSDEAGRAWYRTGDLVVENAAGDYVFRGRRDRMVKKRGYRVELGEIETCLYRYPAVRQAAVIAIDGADGVRIKALICTDDGKRLSQIALKSFCAQHLPMYMVPDLFEFAPSLPRTSTDKIDYQQLAQQTASLAS